MFHLSLPNEPSYAKERRNRKNKIVTRNFKLSSLNRPIMPKNKEEKYLVTRKFCNCLFWNEDPACLYFLVTFLQLSCA